jgi:hypothetical protein
MGNAEMPGLRRQLTHRESEKYGERPSLPPGTWQGALIAFRLRAGSVPGADYAGNGSRTSPTVDII